MMHDTRQVGFGRLGTMDVGDMVVVKRVGAASEVETLVEGGRARYGLPGDVIVYFPANDRASTPIIHRAIAYVEPVYDGYRVRWGASACVGGATKQGGWCHYGPSGVTLPQISLADYRPEAAGFITKGDNPVTNLEPDVTSGISHDAKGRPSIVRVAWVEGKARGEVPWLGLVKLTFAGEPNEHDPPASYLTILWASAPRDLWTCLALTLVVLVGGPFAWDWARRRRGRD